jgi:hypothetical protein
LPVGKTYPAATNRIVQTPRSVYYPAAYTSHLVVEIDQQKEPPAKQPCPRYAVRTANRGHFGQWRIRPYRTTAQTMEFAPKNLAVEARLLLARAELEVLTPLQALVALRLAACNRAL